MNVNTDESLVFNDFIEGKLNLFYRKVYPGLIIYARKFLDEDTKILAEDFVQDVLIEAWDCRKNLTNIYALKSFLYKSLKNDILNSYRKNASRARYLGQLEDPVYFRNSVIDQETRNTVYNAINDLPDHERQVFVMNVMEGLKLGEIAEKLSVSERTVKKYKKDALDRLREKLDPYVFMTLFMFS